MPRTNAVAAATADEKDGHVIPMFVCAGCRPEPLGYTSLELGDRLDEIVPCPLREVCTWHAAHDLGESAQYNEQPAGAQLTPLFRTEPYFSCPNFHDYWTFAASGRLSRPTMDALAHATASAAACGVAVPPTSA